MTRLQVNGKTISKQVDETAVTHTIATLPPNKRATILLSQGKKGTLHAVGRPRKGFRLMWRDAQGDTRFSQQASIDQETTTRILAAYAADAADWHKLTGWLPPNTYGYQGQNPILNFLSNLSPGLGALLIFGLAFITAVIYLQFKPVPGGAPGGREILLGLAAITAIAGYIQYIDFFFKRIRPWLAGWLGSRLGLSVREDLTDARWFGGAGAGTWDASGGTFGRRLLLHLLDLLILVAGLIGPVAVVSIGLFLLFD